MVGAITYSGAIIHMKYWPFGATRSGSTYPSMYAYAGQETQTWTTIGAYNYKVRFYSTTLGRFVSADPTLGGEQRLTSMPTLWAIQ